jgi:hypothetical protein
MFMISAVEITPGNFDRKIKKYTDKLAAALLDHIL